MEFSGHYLEYEEYLNMGGSLAETPFDLLEFEARRKIDERTQGRLKKINEIPIEVKVCTFSLINVLFSYVVENSTKKNISSESVGSYAVSYVAGSTMQEIIKSKNVEINDIITSYLFGVIVDNQHLIYLGVH